MSITIKNGGSVRLSTIHQYSTYGGLLAGLPNEELNKAIVERSVREANQRLFQSDGNIKVTLVEPVIGKQEVNIGEERKFSYPCLPGYVTTILLEDMDHHGIVVLFTNKIANYDEISKSVSNLDWTEISEEFCW
jgi:hypothetical protein